MVRNNKHERLKYLGKRNLPSDLLSRVAREYGHMRFRDYTIRPRTIKSAKIETITDRIMRRTFENGGPQEHYDPKVDSVPKRIYNDAMNHVRYYVTKGMDHAQDSNPYLPLILVSAGLLMVDFTLFSTPSVLRAGVYAIIIALTGIVFGEAQQHYQHSIEQLAGQLLRNNPDQKEHFKESMRNEVRRRVHYLKHVHESGRLPD